jgi:hypothetical protein
MERMLPRKLKRPRQRRRRLREYLSIIPFGHTHGISETADAPSTHAPATESKDKETSSSHIESHSKEEAEAKPFAPAETGSESEKKEEVSKEHELAAAASKAGPMEEGDDAEGAEAKKAE